MSKLWTKTYSVSKIHTQTHTRLMALCPGLPGWAGTRKIKLIWILLKQETVSGSGISWAICKSTPLSRQITTSAPHHSVFYRPDALPAAQPTDSVKALKVQRLSIKWQLCVCVLFMSRGLLCCLNTGVTLSRETVQQHLSSCCCYCLARQRAVFFSAQRSCQLH